MSLVGLLFDDIWSTIIAVQHDNHNREFADAQQSCMDGMESQSYFTWQIRAVRVSGLDCAAITLVGGDGFY